MYFIIHMSDMDYFTRFRNKGRFAILHLHRRGQKGKNIHHSKFTKVVLSRDFLLFNQSKVTKIPLSYVWFGKCACFSVYLL